jgi:hypothetical protein
MDSPKLALLFRADRDLGGSKCVGMIFERKVSKDEPELPALNKLPNNCGQGI